MHRNVLLWLEPSGIRALNSNIQLWNPFISLDPRWVRFVRQASNFRHPDSGFQSNSSFLFSCIVERWQTLTKCWLHADHPCLPSNNFQEHWVMANEIDNGTFVLSFEPLKNIRSPDLFSHPSQWPLDAVRFNYRPLNQTVQMVDCSNGRLFKR